MLFQSVGYPTKLTALVANQLPFVTVEETGEQVPTTRPDAAMIIGELAGGGLLEDAGKPFKVVMTACMHKLLGILNAMVVTGTPWSPSP